LKSFIPDYENTSLGTQGHTPEDLNPQHKTPLNFTEGAKYFTGLIAHLYKHKHQLISHLYKHKHQLIAQLYKHKHKFIAHLYKHKHQLIAHLYKHKHQLISHL